MHPSSRASSLTYAKTTSREPCAISDVNNDLAPIHSLLFLQISSISSICIPAAHNLFRLNLFALHMHQPFRMACGHQACSTPARQDGTAGRLALEAQVQSNAPSQTSGCLGTGHSRFKSAHSRSNSRIENFAASLSLGKRERNTLHHHFILSLCRMKGWRDGSPPSQRQRERDLFIFVFLVVSPSPEPFLVSPPSLPPDL